MAVSPLVWLVLAGSPLLLEILAPGFGGLLAGAIGAPVASWMSAVTPIIPTWLQMAIFLGSLLAGGIVDVAPVEETRPASGEVPGS